MQINLFLLDPLDATKSFSPGVPSDIQRYLQDKLNRVVSAANALVRPSPQHTLTVTWSATKPVPKDADWLIYFVPQDLSIVWKFKTCQKFNPFTVKHWGYTCIPARARVQGQVEPASAASEVYCKEHDGDKLGALAFHESMHHKMLIGPALHKPDGLAAAEFDFSNPPQLTKTNIDAMAKALTTEVKQWTGGFDILMNCKQRRDMGDPSWNEIP